MPNPSHRSLSCAALVFCAASAVAFSSGCGTDTAPAAPVPEGPRFLAFSPQAAQRAAKLATLPSGGLAISQIFSIWGDHFTVTDLNGPDVTDDLKVTFSVPQGGLNAPLLITMTVLGNTARDLVMAFDPAGLLFLGAAELQVILGDDRLDIPLAQIQAYHAYADGTVVDATILSRTDGEGVSEIRIEVPGFSRYGMRGSQ
jgi:hypothetical protein